MQMETFWDSVPAEDKLTRKYAASYFATFEEDTGVPVDEAEFAFSTIPNMGPAGPTSPEDEADFDSRDPEQHIVAADGPSLSDDDSRFMAYSKAVDELWTYTPDAGWLLWNY